MRHLLIFGLTGLFALIAAVIVAALANASPPAPLVFGPWEYEDTQEPVEQQTPGGALQPDRSLWVLNPTGCAWDPDDSRSAGGVNSVLDAGASASGVRCEIVDDVGHWWSWSVRASSPNLEVTFTHALKTVHSRAVPDAGGYLYAGCLSVEYDRSAVSSLPLVEGSNGGHGVRSDTTVTVANLTSRRVRDIHAVMRTRLSNFVNCPGWAGDYPGPWVREGVYPGPFVSWATT
jgi:hypothetical protein